MTQDGDGAVPGDFLAALAKWRAVRETGEEHSWLARLAGQWNVMVRFHGGEQVYESSGTATKETAHGGRFLVEALEGEIQAPDDAGQMRPEPYSATRIVGYDRYKKSWVGVFMENQNTSLLTFGGPLDPFAPTQQMTLFGLCDEPMLDLHDIMNQYVLRVESDDRHVWEVFAMAAGGRKVFDFVYER